ncbi:MAG TPA: helicase-exonuclease AddAB subunit AddA [Mogibacterium sp.]|nr:helicase-exonuclease AddAB subunit AddA [Mogibacterium sp.]
MAVKFTDEQLQAINTVDKSVLVSAAAGSGKTAVLIERIIKIIIEGKADVDEMLVVTFTKAAASEMRLKLSRAVKKRMIEHPEERKRLRGQLDSIYRAYISTFDSFAVRVIREFFYLIDAEPDFKASDEVQSTILQREAADELFEFGFENDDFIEGAGFREFLRLYSEERNDNTFKENLIKAYQKLRTMPEYFDWAYEKAENLKITKDKIKGSFLQELLAEDLQTTMSQARDAALKAKDVMISAGLQDMFDEKMSSEFTEIEYINNKAQAGELDEDLITHINEISYGRMATKKHQKEAWEGIKEEIKILRDAYKQLIESWKKKYLIPDLDTRFAEMNDTYRYTVYYLGLLEEFERIYAAKKAEKKLLDFADMEHIAVEIIKNEKAANTLKKRFKYIFIDEYQDTNNIQEYLISKIAGEDNVFRVGDVKQSIYKFRQAEPAIFERVYREYSDQDNEKAVAINLNKNFRSNSRTINYINTVFENIMESYDEDAKLNVGCICPDEYDFIPEVHILCDEGIEDVNEAIEDADEEIQNLSKEEAEANYVAGLIQNIIGKDFYDTDKKVVRPVEARDIVILMRAVKVRGEIMTRALRASGIDSHIEESDNYFDAVEIGIALSLFSCIDNMKRDIPLIAVLHSEIFGWTPSELAEARADHMKHRSALGESRRTPFWEVVLWYADEGPNEKIRKAAAHAVSKIKEWRALSNMMPVDDFIWKVLIDSGYYHIVGAMYGGRRRQANLRVLVDRARKYSEDTIASLNSFLSFLEVMKQKNISNGQASMVSKEDNVVIIETIHKSKGLEYPFVIVSGMGNNLKSDNLGKDLGFDSQIGIGLPYIDPDRRFWRSTIMQRAIHSRGRAESFKEELRILYVAMTRARNKLILVGSLKSEADLMKYTTSPKKYFEIMKEVLKTKDNEYYIRPLERKDVKDSRTHVTDIIKARRRNLSGRAEKIYREIDRRLSYKYPYKDLLYARSKYSVSELRIESVKAEKQAEKISAKTDKKKVNAADLGTAYHRIMEFLDFNKVVDSGGNIDKSYINSQAEYLLENKAIDAEVFREIDITKIYEFFESDLGRRAVAATARGVLAKEKQFVLKADREGHEILVQGVIDCCFEEDGRMILIDYKTNFMRRDLFYEELERIRAEYKTQIDLYAKAVQEGTGLPVEEAYLYMFSLSESIKMLG